MHPQPGIVLILSSGSEIFWPGTSPTETNVAWLLITCLCIQCQGIIKLYCKYKFSWPTKVIMCFKWEAKHGLQNLFMLVCSRVPEIHKASNTEAIEMSEKIGFQSYALAGAHRKAQKLFAMGNWMGKLFTMRNGKHHLGKSSALVAVLLVLPSVVSQHAFFWY